MKKVETFFLIIIFILFLICLVGCNNKVETEDTKLKINEELNYLEAKIISILNNVNNISLENYTITSEEIELEQTEKTGEKNKESSKENKTNNEKKESTSQSKNSDETKKSNITTMQMEPKTILETNENDVDWKKIKNDIEIISESWPVIAVDLTNSNINSSDILEFSNTLNECILSIKEENKINILKNFAKLYSIIPKIENQIPNESESKNIRQIKSYIINAYSLIEQEDWIEIESNISQAEETLKEIISDQEYIKNREYKVKKAQILIKELQNSLKYKDKKLFYIKYKNLLQNIKVL